MSIAHYFSLCGGKNNITRVLAPEDKLIFSVAEIDLITRGEYPYEVTNVLGEYQLVFDRPESIGRNELLEIGQVIADRQQSHLTKRTIPTECPYRPEWHISPPNGLLNDPNGFIYHNGEYHLFYQWYPYACQHKDKHWVHQTSTDLINWRWQSVVLTPSDWFDSHGVFSGHAVSHNEQLMLFYTGNTRIGQQRDRHTTQCVAVSSDGRNFVKRGPVISELPDGVTPHIRDPKIIRHNQEWLMLLGAQTTELKGRIALYRSNDLENWQYDGLYGAELGDFGYMWECPDMFILDEQHYLIIGPQGIESFSPHNTVPHHNGIVKANWNNQQGIDFGEFAYLDYGFDFYAPQTMLTPDGRRILCAWMGLPDEVDQPSVENGWIHQLTAMRELSVKEGKLIQWPIGELDRLVASQTRIELTNEPYDLKTKSYDLSIELEWGATLHLFEGSEHKLIVHADMDKSRLILDRSNTLNWAQDSIRELPVQSERINLRILADNSSVEIFVNHGDAVMTSRVFTAPDATSISLHGARSPVTIKKLNPSAAPFKSVR